MDRTVAALDTYAVKVRTLAAAAKSTVITGPIPHVHDEVALAALIAAVTTLSHVVGRATELLSPHPTQLVTNQLKTLLVAVAEAQTASAHWKPLQTEAPPATQETWATPATALEMLVVAM